MFFAFVLCYLSVIGLLSNYQFDRQTDRIGIALCIGSQCDRTTFVYMQTHEMIIFYFSVFIPIGGVGQILE